MENLFLTLNQMLYIDPAATSILLTSITSIVVALGATFIILWRKFKKGVKKTFKIDENAGKEVEEEIVVYEDEKKDDNVEEVKQKEETEIVDMETKQNNN